jgi:ferredoxin
MAERLKKKGVLVIDYYDCYADIMIPFYPSPTLTTGHPDAHDLDDARVFGQNVAKRCQMISDSKSPHIEAPRPVPESWVRGAESMSLQYVRKIMPPLHLDIQKCTRCYACQDECPVEGIDVDSDPPKLQNPCIFCWRCVNVCPTLAIEGNWEKLVSMAPANYSRYRKSLNEAAERGEFRWLIDPASVDCSDPLYKQRERKIKKR